MNTQHMQVALITGASSGIGKATALALVSAGYIAYATARRLDALETLKDAGCRALQLDVTDEQSMVAAVRAVEAEYGAIDVLVNNAGYGELGPIEEIALENWRRQFVTNVFGPVRLIQLALPAMRARGKGRIINVSSMGGEMTFPFAGAYHASKYALEAISDALRFEVAPFGIDVIVIQPSAVRTPLGDASVAGMKTSAESPYGGTLAAFAAVSSAAYEQGIGVESPERVGEVIVQAAQDPQPHTRYKIGATAEQLVTVRRSLPDREWDAMLRQQYGLA